MTARLGAILCVGVLSFATQTAASSNSAALHPTTKPIMFDVSPSGMVFIECHGLTDATVIRKTLEKLKQGRPDVPIGFYAEKGASPELAEQYREMIVGMGFKFGQPGGFCP